MKGTRGTNRTHVLVDEDRPEREAHVRAAHRANRRRRSGGGCHVATESTMHCNSISLWDPRIPRFNQPNSAGPLKPKQVFVPETLIIISITGGGIDPNRRFRGFLIPQLPNPRAMGPGDRGKSLCPTIESRFRPSKWKRLQNNFPEGKNCNA